jgi:hypothetical protein
MACLDRISQWDIGQSPFDRLIAFEVYDGATSGMVFCSGGAEALRFSLAAWDERQEARVFTLAPIAAEDATEVVKILTGLIAPRWPEWWLGQPRNHNARRAVDAAISRLVGRSQGERWVVLTEDLLKGPGKSVGVPHGLQRRRFESLSARDSPDAEVSKGTFAEWVGFMERATTGL